MTVRNDPRRRSQVQQGCGAKQHRTADLHGAPHALQEATVRAPDHAGGGNSGRNDHPGPGCHEQVSRQHAGHGGDDQYAESQRRPRYQRLKPVEKTCVRRIGRLVIGTETDPDAGHDQQDHHRQVRHPAGCRQIEIAPLGLRVRRGDRPQAYRDHTGKRDQRHAAERHRLEPWTRLREESQRSGEGCGSAPCRPQGNERSSGRDAGCHRQGHVVSHPAGDPERDPHAQDCSVPEQDARRPQVRRREQGHDRLRNEHDEHLGRE